MIGKIFLASLAMLGVIGKPLISSSAQPYEKTSYLSGETEIVEKQIREENDEELGEEKIANIKHLISYLEEELDKSGSSVEKELKKQANIMKKKQLANTNKKTSSKSKSKTKKEESNGYGSSSVLEDMLIDYQNYKASQEIQIVDASTPNRMRVMTGAGNRALILAAHTLIVSHFSNHNWRLSAELLAHMRENDELDSIYRPANSDIVYYSDVFRQLGYRAEKSGTGSFEPNAANFMQQDLYYAIHSFNYTKSLHNDAIVLTDRYDFEQDLTYDNLIQDLACNIIYDGQSLGILKPFYTVVEFYNSYNLEPDASRTISVSFLSSCDWQYKEVQITLAEDDCVYVYFSFPTSGYRTLQTFGDKDTTIELFKDEGGLTYCGYNDDNGYESNALLTYNFQANVHYSALVQFYYSNDIGNVRLAFTSSNATNYESITKIQNYNVLVQNERGRVSLFTLTPVNSRNFTIETTKKDVYQDTVLYFVDPRRGDSHYKNNYPSCAMDDDGGSNRQAKLSLGPKPTNVPFLIVASTYSSTLIGKFNLVISGLDSGFIIVGL